MRARELFTCLLFAVLSAATQAGAQTAPAAEQAVTNAALPLKLELGRSKLDPESLRKAVELELKRPVALTTTVPAAGTPSLTVVTHPNHTVTVSYLTSSGLRRTRSIGMPEDAARGAEVIALLAGNLSRDEAAELLAQLAAKASPPASAAGPESETPTKDAAGKPDAAPEPSAVATRPPPSPQHAPLSNPPPLLETPAPAINLSLLAPTALYRDSERRIFVAEFGLAYSHVGELHGAGLNLFALHTERDLRGMSFATFYNYSGGTVTGVSGSAVVNRRRRLRGVAFSGVLNLGSADAQGASFAGLANLEQDFEGFQAAGLVNWAGIFRGGQAAGLFDWADRFEGAQSAGLVNWATGFQGAQIAGLFNRVRRFEGVQAAGLVNWANGSQGLQLAGAFNRAEAFTGLQAAGALNIADSLSGLEFGGVNLAGDVQGLQLGVVNVAGDVQGLQLGVVNVAKHVDGTSIGLVSVANNGRVEPVLWASSSLPLNAAAKFIVGPVYTQAGFGYAPGNQTYTYELGLGLHFPIGRFFFLEPAAHYSEMRSTKHPFDHELIEYGHYRLAAGLDLGKVSPFVGGGVLQRFAHRAEAPASVPVAAEAFGGVAFF
ncbi:MAG: hypothetical protein WDO69_31340 [Pseudomonadota bacterium]